MGYRYGVDFTDAEQRAFRSFLAEAVHDGDIALGPLDSLLVAFFASELDAADSSEESLLSEGVNPRDFLLDLLRSIPPE